MDRRMVGRMRKRKRRENGGTGRVQKGRGRIKVGKVVNKCIGRYGGRREGKKEIAERAVKSGRSLNREFGGGIAGGCCGFVGVTTFSRSERREKKRLEKL